MVTVVDATRIRKKPDPSAIISKGELTKLTYDRLYD